ncbi:MAG: hypothetical protein K5919_00400 [Clostridiales bacterium]|nr:hypothetical protein [Clostridiales bacterium]
MAGRNNYHITAHVTWSQAILESYFGAEGGAEADEDFGEDEFEEDEDEEYFEF